MVVAETRETDSGALRALQEEVRNNCNDLLGMPPDEVVLAPPHAVLKTSSGKIRRAAVRELFEQNRIGQRPRAVWLQVVRVALENAVSVASILLLTEATMTEIPEAKQPNAAPGEIGF